MVASRVRRAASSPAEMRPTIAVVGMGNIGSHVLPLVARLSDLGALTIIDRDVYEAKNLGSQAIRPGDVGKAKAHVQAARARRLAPALAVRAVIGDLATLPLGTFRADVVLGCLDSRAARQRLGEITFRMGTPYLDGGVNAAALLARVSVYDSDDAAAPCLECAWSAADYDALEQVHPCQGQGAASAPATDAPAALGGLAAALLALECEKRLRGRPDRLAAGTEVLIDAASHTHHRTHDRRNPACRFGHERWTIERLGVGPAALSLDELLARVGGASSAETELRVEGQRFVLQLACAACGAVRPVVRLAAALRPRDRVCVACGQATAPRGFDLDDRLVVAALAPHVRRRPLRALGLRAGDVVSLVHATGTRHFELA